MSVSGAVTAQKEQPTAPAPFPWNRVVTVLGPYVSLVSGALATWLIQHFPGLHLSESTLSATIADAIAFSIGAGGTFFMQHKWLSGWQQWEGRLIDAASLSPPAVVSGDHAGSTQVGGLPPGAGEPIDQPQISPDAQREADQPQILPDAQQEMASIPDGDRQVSLSTRPETAVIPDVPGDEVEPAEL